MARTDWRRLAASALLLLAGQAGADPATIERGRRLFEGQLPLAGRVTGHSTDLPAAASRCANCHAAGTALPAGGGVRPAAAAASANASQSFGPALSAAALTRDLPRRGGPPSRYDEAALCKLLATGIDPAYVIIPRSMPRYDLPAADCSALWAYLTRP
jgi:hypothetical protein